MTILQPLTGSLRTHGHKMFHFPAQGVSLSYSDIHQRATLLRAALEARGLKPQEHVGLLFGNCPESLIALFGVLSARGVVVSLPQPTGINTLGAYLLRVTQIVENAEVRFIIVGNEYAAAGLEMPPGVVMCSVEELLAEAELIEGAAQIPELAPLPHDRALVQYTSGSTSEPKGVAISHANLQAGIAAIVHGIEVTSDDVNGQWLPLYHDMGLIGMLAGVAKGVTHHLWPPSSFVRHPGKWLAEFAARRCTVYAGPNFSYASMLAKTKDEQLEGMDLSAWRVAFNGAQVIDPVCVQGFIDRFSPVGFRPEAMLPVYGLAEATLAVTFPSLGSLPAVHWVDRQALTDRQQLVAAAPDAEKTRGLVRVGKPVLGHEVRIMDAAGREVAEGVAGEIEVRGPAVMASYWKKSSAESGINTDGWFRTGDLGAMIAGELVVCGRIKEMIIVRGSNFYPQDIEWVVRDLEGVYRGRSVAFGLDNEGQERAAIVVETEAWAAGAMGRRVQETVLRQLGLSDLDVIVVRPRSIRRTTSGKLQRLLMRELYLSGELKTDIHPDAVAQPAA